MNPTKERSSKLPIIALISVAALIASAWIFFLATDELARINYDRKVQQSTNWNRSATKNQTGFSSP